MRAARDWTFLPNLPGSPRTPHSFDDGMDGGFGIKRPQDFLSKPGKSEIPWERWISLFGCFVGACGAHALPSECRRYLLRHCLGVEGQRVFDTLPSSRAIAVPSPATTSAVAASRTPTRDVYQVAVDTLSFSHTNA